jgi:checkpoint serine/threonine-protein kinase
MCLKYADSVPDPRESFSFIEQHGIGAQTVILYTAWAFLLENMGDTAEAERVFETGMVKLTNPANVEMLAGRREQYRERVAEAARRKRDEPDDEPDQTSEEGRRALGDVRKSKRGRVAVNRAPVESRGGLASRSASSKSRGASKSNGAGAGGSLAVFEDPEGAHSAKPASSAKGFHSLPQDSRVSKENTKAASTWKGGIGTKAKSTAPVDFAVFQDESGTTEASAPATKPAATGRRAFERKALGNFKQKAPVVLMQDYAREQGTTRNVVGGYLKYDPVPIYGGAEEFQFEEIRASVWLSQQEMLRANDDNELDVEMEMDGAPSPSPAPAPASRGGSEMFVEDGAVAEAEPQQFAPVPAPAQAFTVFEEEETAPAPAPAPAPTTFAVFEEENDQPQPPAAEKMSALDATQPTDHTISKHLAFDQTDDVPAYTGYGADSPKAIKSFGSGDQTINTKEAMAEIMGMFGTSERDSSCANESFIQNNAVNARSGGGGGAAVALAVPRQIIGFKKAAKVAPAAAAGGFSIFTDEGDDADGPEVDENQENFAPTAYQKPAVSAAQEAAETHNTQRSVLTVVPGFGAASPAPAANMAPSFDDVMHGLGLDLAPRAAAAVAVAEAQTSAPSSDPAPAFEMFEDDQTEKVPAVAQSSFAMFEDPPTQKLVMPPNMSFVQSTPFARAADTSTEKPSVTPIHTEQEASLGNASVASSMYEDENSTLGPGLAPILETSKDGDRTQVSMINMSSAVAPGYGEDGATAWPPADATLFGLMAHVDFADAANCVVSRAERCPPLAEGVSIQMAGMEQALSLAMVQEELDDKAAYVAAFDEDEESMFLVKTASPPCPWEFHILTTLQNRLQANPAAGTGMSRRSFPTPASLHCFADKHMFAIDHIDNYSLKDVIALNQKLCKDMDEPMIMFYTIEMLKMLEALHAAKIVHGKFHDGSMTLRDEHYDGILNIVYSPIGKGGWSTKGLRLTDFEHGVDFERMPASQRLTNRAGNWEKMVEYDSWTYEIDYHGLASTVHRMLFRGTEMELSQSDEGSWAPTKKFKAFWQKLLWQELFDALLNFEAGSVAPLSQLRQNFESYLNKNPFKAKSLKQNLIKQDTALAEQ